MMCLMGGGTIVKEWPGSTGRSTTRIANPPTRTSSGSIFTNRQISILRNRFDLIEGPSGCKLSDRLTGRDVVIGGCDHNEDSTVFTNRESIAPLARPKRT